MKLLIVYAAILFMFSACGREDDAGGRLPMLVVDRAEGGVLFPVDYGGVVETEPLEVGAVLARIGDDQPVPRQIAARMLEAAGFSGMNGVWEFLYELPPSEEIMPPPARAMLTLREAQEILAALNPQGPGLLLTDENRHSQISYALWVDLFLRLLRELEIDGFSAINIVPLSQGDALVITNLGPFAREGVNFAAYFDMEIRVLVREGEIVALLGLTDMTPTIRNAMILRTDILGATVFAGGVSRNYVYADGTAVLPPGTVIANVKISGSRIIGAEPSEEVIRGTILRLDESRIELREWGELPLCGGFAVYGIAAGEAVFKSSRELLVGADIADFHILNGRVAAAVITREISPAYIRVVIGTTGFAGLVHESAALTSCGAFTVRAGGREERFGAGEVFTASACFWGGTRFYISPESPESRLEIVGLRRNWPGGASPQYRGVMEIAPKNGGFVIINELPLEEYLYAVVPSEMPSGHGLEASKVQAVTARSFAYRQFYENRFRAYGAHVDDSVISQVYNNIPENELSREAVRATRGQVLMFGGQVIAANYFSTSGGTTANFGEVWAAGEVFPGGTPVYLRAMPQFDMNLHSPGDLTRENYAAAFFKNTEIPGFDRAFPWFRWHVRMTSAELSERINAVHNIGTLTSIEVLRRGQGGNIMEVLLTGTESAINVKTEFNIRTVLNPGSIPVTRHDGSQVSGLSLLPSAFFTMEKETGANGLAAITFFGGGHGHGVGMSQNGAKALLDMGLSYLEVLTHFYPGAEIVRPGVFGDAAVFVD